MADGAAPAAVAPAGRAAKFFETWNALPLTPPPGGGMNSTADARGNECMELMSMTSCPGRSRYLPRRNFLQLNGDCEDDCIVPTLCVNNNYHLGIPFGQLKKFLGLDFG